MKRNLDVEIARLYGFACVVIAHANSLTLFREFPMTGFIIDELCRSVIQLFFLVSGFFWKPEQIDRPLAYLRALFPKLAIPFAIWAAIYLALDASQLLYPYDQQPRTWKSYITTPWSGGIVFHLWFLPALFVGTAIGMTLIKWIGLSRALIAVFILFLIGTMLGTYLRPFGIDVPLSLYRNGIFFAPIFLVGGYYLKTLVRLPSFSAFAAMAVFGAILGPLEGYYIARTYPSGHDLSFATLPFGIGVFGMFLHLKSNAEGVAGWGRDVFGAYLAHVLIMKVLIEIFYPATTPLTIVACIVGTFVLSLAFSRLAKQNRWLRHLTP